MKCQHTTVHRREEGRWACMICGLDFVHSPDTDELITLRGDLERETLDRVDLQGEIERLREWKKSAISVTPPMQDIGQELDLPLGDSIHDKILPAIWALKAELRQADDALEIATTSNKEIKAEVERLRIFVSDQGTTMWSCEQCGHARSGRGCVYCERDRYREALEEIMDVGGSGVASQEARIASRVLEGE